MAGFDLSTMIPLYLDETDEFIAALNDVLLRLEDDPEDVKSLQEAFRHVHTIKGSSALLGFQDVKALTHELETIFDQLRSRKRALDRPVMQLFFRCLDGLRDYHANLRATGAGGVDLAALAAEVVAHLKGQITPPADHPPAPTSTDAPAPETATPGEDPGESAQPAVATPTAPTVPTSIAPEERRLGLAVEFQQGLPLTDLKARLVVTRLGARGRDLTSDPPAEKLEDAGEIRTLTVWLTSDATEDDLRALADVDGVVSIRFLEAASASAVAPVASRPAQPAVHDASGIPASAAGEASNRTARVAETVRVDIDRLDSLMNLAGELVINKARFQQVTTALEQLFRASSAQTLAGDVLERLDALERNSSALVLPSRSSAGADDRWQAQLRGLREDFRAIRAELDLIRQGREHVQALADALNQLGRVTDGVQKGVLNTRMVPIGPLFGRFRRVVRDLGVASGKEITLVLQGEKTELDKRMIDELGDPLVHMVRNSIDHGLEPPGERSAAGKPPAGTVRLSASHRGNSVLITVADDGRGIDPDRIRRKALANRLIGEDEAARMGERELVSLIWHPGFSTADRVTDISGRGVGMDIVKSRIEALNGTVDVRSTIGQGTAFLVRLPLTLAIMPSLLVRIYDETYAIPLDHIREIVEEPAIVRKVRGQRTLDLRSQVIGLVELNDLFRWSGGDHPSIGPSPSRRRVVLVTDGETTLGLAVDELIGIQEVVLKSLDRNYGSIAGLSGASILGDGRVSLILDVNALVEMAGRPARRPARSCAGD